MEVLYEVCCGLDVHKKTVTACLLRGRRAEIRTFSTMTGDLQELAGWLRQAGCRHVAMESTGVYWKPIFNVLEEEFEVLLVNARHIKAVPGRKSDVADSEWLARLLQHGLLRGSFIPTRQLRELRDLTRQETKLRQEQATIVNRIHKLLEDANIKLAAVATDVMGKSGQAILEALIAGQTDPEELAQLARGRLRAKLPALREALAGEVSEHHRFLLEMLLAQWRFNAEMLEILEARIEEKIRPFAAEIQLLVTIPGVNRRVARALVAEIGVDMNQFPTAAHLASWAGLCPGKNESAGKNRSGKTRKGNRWVRRILSQAAWAASREKRNYLRTQFWRLAKRRGKKRAAVAVSHSIIKIAYCLLRDQVPYQELDLHSVVQYDKEQQAKRLMRELRELGYSVTVKATAA